MIQSRWPFWRTNGAGLPVSGVAPALIGLLAVVIIPPVAGIIVNFIAAGVFGPVSPTTSTIQNFGLMLIGSPLMSWAALIFAIPLSAYLARKGFAGWGVAVLSGVIFGLILDPILNGARFMSPQTVLTVTTGVVLATIYWLTIRLTYPAAIGVPPKRAKA